MRVAIVGGGPGGLMTARALERKSDACEITLFEASHRLGGKIQTRRFAALPKSYEAGVAECYDYEAFGRDPLKELVRELGLVPVPTRGGAIVLNGVLLREEADIATRFGSEPLAEIRRFRRDALAMAPFAEWYCTPGPDQPRHPWAARTCEDLLDQVRDSIARRYLRISAHSDMATEPHLTTGIAGLRNLLMNVPGRSAQYTLAGGMERLPQRLAAQLVRTDVRLHAAVRSVSKCADGRYAVVAAIDGRMQTGRFDAVVAALPYYLLHGIEWGGARLRRAMTRHVARYDPPGHYLRISILFDEPFWRRHISGSWLTLDAFGGCCVYDEQGSGAPGAGVLGWLIAGRDALALCNESDETIVARALESLPERLRADAQRRALESRVHRWAGSVSAVPGGSPWRSTRAAHQPEPVEHERLAVVGDYLFDSTLNGLLRSADIAADIVVSGRPQRRGRLRSRETLTAGPPAGAAGPSPNHVVPCGP